MTTTSAPSDPRLEWFRVPTYRKTEGRLRWAKRLENTSSRSAEYTVTVTETPAKEYVVERTFGPLGNPSHHASVATTPDIVAAVQNAQSITRGKTGRRDYVEIQSWEDVSDAPELMDADPAAWDVSEFLPAEEPANADPKEPTEPTEPPTRDCNCATLFHEIGVTKYVDVMEGTPAVAPMLGLESSAMMELPPQTGARWIVGVNPDCAPGYPHARAVPVGPAMDGSELAAINRRNAAEWIEDVVTKYLRPEHTRRLKSFALLVEEAEVNLIVLDIEFGSVNESWAAGGDVAHDAAFNLRRSFLNEVWSNTFTETDAIRLVPLRTARLREEFLANDGTKRFELVDQTQTLPLVAIRLPVLK